mmetsp:Transcript_144/g.449  ORF Transcript_144/g.449 Transcript_144/m.449 type:complete len:224 (-) Transcript_144:414-1085(-)
MTLGVRGPRHGCVWSWLLCKSCSVHHTAMRGWRCWSIISGAGVGTWDRWLPHWSRRLHSWLNIHRVPQRCPLLQGPGRRCWRRYRDTQGTKAARSRPCIPARYRRGRPASERILRREARHCLRLLRSGWLGWLRLPWLLWRRSTLRLVISPLTMGLLRIGWGGSNRDARRHRQAARTRHARGWTHHVVGVPLHPDWRCVSPRLWNCWHWQNVACRHPRLPIRA